MNTKTNDRKLTRILNGLGRSLSAVASITVVVGMSVDAYAAKELNALVWCDHTDPALIKPFEEKHDVKVNLKEYEGTGAALAIAAGKIKTAVIGAGFMGKVQQMQAGAGGTYSELSDADTEMLRSAALKTRPAALEALGAEVVVCPVAVAPDDPAQITQKPSMSSPKIPN